jgi:hypothetical protein
MKTYYKTEDNDLIVFNSENNIYTLKSTINLDNKIDNDYFKTIVSKKINKNKFRELLNKYFKKIKHKWKFEHVWYEKLPNLNINDGDIKERIEKIPLHSIDKHKCYNYMYYQGRVVLALLFYNSENQCILYSPHDGKNRGWTSINNLAPILNLETNQII